MGSKNTEKEPLLAEEFSSVALEAETFVLLQAHW